MFHPVNVLRTRWLPDTNFALSCSRDLVSHFQAVSLSPNRKRVKFPRCLTFGELPIVNSSIGRFADLIEICPNCLGRSLDDHLNASVWQVLYPAANVMSVGHIAAGHAKTNALHASKEKDVPTLIHGSLPILINSENAGIGHLAINGRVVK